jgi:hypothetical protein
VKSVSKIGTEPGFGLPCSGKPYPTSGQVGLDSMLVGLTPGLGSQVGAGLANPAMARSQVGWFSRFSRASLIRVGNRVSVRLRKSGKAGTG